MSQPELQPVVNNFAPSLASFREDVLQGLRAETKSIPCKYFYDEEGARLFEEICELPEYYPTRTELGIMEKSGGEMASYLGPRCLVIEYGSGSGIKTRLLLAALVEPAGYVPIDIAWEQLAEAAGALQVRFPDLEVAPVCADYTRHYRVPATRQSPARQVVYFPGSTIGNFDPTAALGFLGHVQEVCGPRCGLLIGVDLKKDKGILERAYNDTAGVTARFNLNLLHRLQRELGAEIQVDQFRHHAFFNEVCGRIEMHLVSTCRQTVRIGGEAFEFAAGETIHTENSHKYSLDGFAALARQSGFRVARVWLDERKLFSVQYLEAV